MSTWLALAAGLGSASLGGFYIAFSLVVMPALRRRPREEATGAMAAINRAAVQAPFMILFFGTTALCGVTALDAFFTPQSTSDWRIIGAILTLASSVLTMTVNVPLNNQLAQGNVRPWPYFERSWSRANHARAVLSAVGAFLLLMPTVV